MKQNKTLIINLFGGPGSSKSTTRSGIFNIMKKEMFKIEEVYEYAKELTYKNDMVTLSDQIYVFATQQHMQQIISPQVDFIVTDSPFIMGSVYVDQNHKNIPDENLKKLMLETHNTYNNLNIFISRNPDRYQKYGRTQDLEEAQTKDKEILDFLTKENIPFIKVDAQEGFLTEYAIINFIKDNYSEYISSLENIDSITSSKELTR